MLRQEQFAKKYDIPEATVNQLAYYNRETEIVVKVDGESMIDDKALMLYHKQNTKLFNLSHDIYYAIEAYGVRDSDQARFIANRCEDSINTWCTYLGKGLWALIPESITYVNRREKMYKYLKYAKLMLRHLRRMDRCRTMRPGVSNLEYKGASCLA